METIAAAAVRGREDVLPETSNAEAHNGDHTVVTWRSAT